MRASMVLLSVLAVSRWLHAQVPVKGPVTLKAGPVRHHVAAFPRLEAGGEVTAAVAEKVDAGLAKLDLSVNEVAADCRKGSREMLPHPGLADWTRSMNVMMRGPRFLSLLAVDSYFCGGMYPNDGILLPMVYDLTTGVPVNWLTYLPAEAKSDLANSGDGAKVGVVTWPALVKRARREAEAGCKSAFDDVDTVQFVLWLEALGGHLLAQPYGFNHATADCASEVKLTVAEAREMGVHGAVLEALEAASKLQ